MKSYLSAFKRAGIAKTLVFSKFIQYLLAKSYFVVAGFWKALRNQSNAKSVTSSHLPGREREEISGINGAIAFTLPHQKRGD